LEAASKRKQKKMVVKMPNETKLLRNQYLIYSPWRGKTHVGADASMKKRDSTAQTTPRISLSFGEYEGLDLTENIESESIVVLCGRSTVRLEDAKRWAQDNTVAAIEESCIAVSRRLPHSLRP
jgi:hypothetical protein